MAFPVINSPTFPSINDAPFLPPKLKDMPIFNPGRRTYRCEDGVTRFLTEQEAINLGISCSAVIDEGGSLMGAGIRVQNLLGQSQGAPQNAPGAQGSPRGANIQVDQPLDLNPFVWPGYPLVAPQPYPQVPPGSSCACEKDAVGNDVYVCRPAPAAVLVPPPAPLYSYGPVSYPVQTFFTGLF